MFITSLYSVTYLDREEVTLAGPEEGQQLVVYRCETFALGTKYSSLSVLD